jgi:surface antigen
VSLPSRLLAPLTTALAGGLVLGLVTLAPTSAAAADSSQRPAAGSSKQAPDSSGQPAARTLRRLRQDPAATVFARSSYLCYGYQNCRDAGMGNGSYAQNNDTMYWRMYAGHNCTNYAAYRMVRSGLPNERPWSGSGNATYWGGSMPRVTDGTPRIGAVAWWKANTGPAGSAGHVAYVERVVSADQIVVSQDSWGGDFSWAVITRSSGNWPSGFVHFNDVPLLNKGVPVVSGLAKVGSVLTSTSGTWKPADADVAYQWFADGEPLEGATTASLKLTRARIGQQITVRTTASSLGYPARSVFSAATEAVQPGALKNVAAPTISGQPQVEHTLTLDGGTWTPEADLAYRWYADGEPVRGATGAVLELTPDLVDRVLTATVTATRQGYEPVTATTAGTAPVAPGALTVVDQPSLAGTARIGETLSVEQGTFRPSDAAASVQWLRDGEPVLNATGPTYVVTELDLGARISALVSLSRAGYEPTDLQTARSAVVQSTPRLGFERERLRHRVRLAITVTSDHVAEVTGTVVVRVEGGFRQEVTLRRGTAHVSVTDLPKGKHTLRMSYRGSSTVEAASRTGAIWMP